jgi:hypothetical protein
LTNVLSAALPHTYHFGKNQKIDIGDLPKPFSLITNLKKILDNF